MSKTISLPSISLPEVVPGTSDSAIAKSLDSSYTPDGIRERVKSAIAAQIRAGKRNPTEIAEAALRSRSLDIKEIFFLGLVEGVKLHFGPASSPDTEDLKFVKRSDVEPVEEVASTTPVGSELSLEDFDDIFDSISSARDLLKSAARDLEDLLDK